MNVEDENEKNDFFEMLRNDPNQDELRALVFSRTNGESFEIIHMVIFEHEPSEDDVNHIFDELANDPEFGQTPESLEGLECRKVSTKDFFEMLDIINEAG